MAELIRAENLTVRYGDHTVLEGVNLRVHSDEILVILGSSGCGKTTLLRHLIGLRPPEAGRVSLFGKDLYAQSSDERAHTLTRIGMLFQSGALFNSMTVEDNVALPLIEHRGIAPEVAAVMARMKLALVGLDSAAHLLPSEISGGMKKRAGLARALALDPEVLLFDEPSAGLDPVTARALDDLILDLKRRFKVGVVVVTHELGSINVITDRAVMLDRGRVIADGTLADLRKMADGRVRAFFSRESPHDGATAVRPIARLAEVAEDQGSGPGPQSGFRP